ncbi:MAG: leucine--tRNA ligase [Bacteroidales bacterium OttesenSCG-928-I14]|jgi:leucyl-tRNA synthetase|nr:leucine--tRNA ligase [Bacteroidales bacterium OttesenSCG-928-I14]
MEYNFNVIEKKWQKYWKRENTYKIVVNKNKSKYYVLDMFPYPSGSGLHVGHPLGYIASDIYARYKRLKGFNVLHPMGYDAYGLPSEQYAIQTGQHPYMTTKKNINRYREQLDKLGFCFDWDREIRTCDPKYYKWTQWVFIQMFNSYYCNESKQAQPINRLIKILEKNGTKKLHAACTKEICLTATKWRIKSEKEKQEILMNYRIAYLSDTIVNWCPILKTVLANDEINDGISIRGGYPIERRKMRQWCLRISAYANRLLKGLDKLEWPDSLKEIQRNWIGYSEGVELRFKVQNSNAELTIFTTRPDTIFGVTFIVIAPENELVPLIIANKKQNSVNFYLNLVKNQTEMDRIANKKITGVFTGTYCINPVNRKPIPIWISDYVLAEYGTGAIMAVPAHDRRDYAFAKHFNLPIIPILKGIDISQKSFDSRIGILINSDFLNGLTVKEAIQKSKEYIENKKIGNSKTNYRLRDAIFSRQRYWGEPLPIYYKNGIPFSVNEKDLPIKLPKIDKFLPTEAGDPPLKRAKNWTYKGYPLELTTMPGFAGSSAYYLRYEDPNNKKHLVSSKANKYWKNVDLYIGGIEHATGHLIYSRFWNKFLFDLNIIIEDEPFKKVINQGMIQGRSNFVYRIKNTNTFVSYGLKNQYDVIPIHVDVNKVSNDILDIESFKKWNPEYLNAEFILENGKYICGWTTEKMSKSMFNVINPDDIVTKFGADVFRLYEMFLGPFEQSKPWNTKGINGIVRFIRNFWNLFFKKDKFSISNEQPTNEEFKILHKALKKISSDIENFSFNTSISAFMICTNELKTLKCNKYSILNELVIALAPFAPHISEELWHLFGNKTSIFDTKFPEYNEIYLKEDTKKYMISFNGKTRFSLNFPLNTSEDDIKNAVLTHIDSKKWLKNKIPKKIIIIPNKIINIVF